MKILIKSRTRVNVNSRDRAQENLRKSAMNSGLKFHRNRAADADKQTLKGYLAIARRSVSMEAPLFLWLKSRMNMDQPSMQQWATYDRKGAPQWAKQEYKAFWGEVVDIYQTKIASLEKSIYAPSPATATPAMNGAGTPTRLVPGTSFLIKSVVYSIETDSTCGDGEFYMLHPKSKKRYKVKVGKPEEVEQMGTPTELVKSWSTNIMKNHPGARWVTITDASSPLHGRHILIMPHANGTASIVWAPEQSGLTHKILQPKTKEKETEEAKAEKLKQKEAKEETRKKRREEMGEEEVERLEAKAEEAKEKKGEAKEKLHEMIREKAGIETEVTAKEKAAIEKKIEKLSKPEQRAERVKEISKVQRERRNAINAIIEDAKKVILGEEIGIDEQHAEDKKRIAEVIRENAEEFLQAHYAIKGHEKELSIINKQLRTGMVTHPGSDIVGISEITTADLKRMVEDEKSLKDEIAAHYDLILNTRGGIDQDGKEIETRGAGRKDMVKMINQGSLEAINGITGEMAGTSIISDAFMQELGAANAAVLADHYLKEKLGEDEYGGHVEHFEEYIESKGTEIALDAVQKGDKYLKKAEHVTTFAKGEKMLYASRQQGSAAKLAYVNRAYLAYGQAEGGLHMAAEMLYQFQSKKKNVVIKSSNRPALNAKVGKLGLNPGDVKIVRHGHGDYEMTVKPKAMSKLIDEKMVAQFKSLEGEPSPQSIKSGRENETDWLPANINSFITKADGSMEKVQPTDHQQSSARFLDHQKKIYLNHEAGTGKSFTYILQKAHLEESLGRSVKQVISMPKKLMENFADEVKKFSNYDVAIVDHPDKSKRAAAYKSDPATIVLVNKEKFYFDHDLIKESGFDLVVADEAHKVTQRGKGDVPGEEAVGSLMSKGLSKIAKEAPYFVAGTGTPTPNDLTELYFHLNIMDPEKYKSQKKFMEKYGALHKGAGLKEKLRDILNAELDDRVFTVKKKVDDVKFNYHMHNTELTEEQRKAYQDIQSKYSQGKINPMSRDQKISGVLNDTHHERNGKYDQVKQIIDNHIANKGDTEKVVLYAKNYSTVKMIEKFLRKNYPKHSSVRFAGQDKTGRSMSLKQIANNKQTFLTDPKAKFAIHTDAGTEGLNLQHTGEEDRPYGATTAIAVASGAHGWANIDQFFSRGYRKGATRDVDGHMVLTDTPHDMATEERLTEKKEIMGMLQEGSKIDDMNVLQQRIAQKAAARQAAEKSINPRVLLPRRMMRV